VQAAERMQEQLRDLTEFDRTQNAPTSDVGKLEADRRRDLERYKDDPAALARVNKHYNARAEKLGQPTGDTLSGTAKLQRDRDAALARGDMAAANEIQRQIEANANKAEGKMTESQRATDTRGNRGLEIQEEELQRKKDADARKIADADKVSIKAIEATVRSVGEELAAAERLLKHPGLSKITGPIYGRTPSLSDEGAGAQALMDQVLGQTFLAALRQLKESSKNGSSGLGQLTEIEGAKIQNAKVALNPIQPTEQMVQTLRAYISTLQNLKTAAEQDLQKANMPVPATPKADPAPAAAPARPAQRNWTVKERK
jgi:hypothetical protein